MNQEEVCSKMERSLGKALSVELLNAIPNIFSKSLAIVKENAWLFEDGNSVNVIDNVPRFVPSDQYTTSFSYQWSTYTQTQLDSAQNSDLTRRDLFGKTGLRPEDVKGKWILDAGVGIGRHTEVLANWGGNVIGIDLSNSVNAASKNLLNIKNAIVLQADIGNLPFQPGIFDVIVSIGVLHHTPDTHAYFRKLVPFLKPGGKIAIWVYPKNFERRGEWIPVTSRLPIKAFQDWCEWAVDVARTNRGNPLLELMINQFPFSTHHSTRERSVLALFDGYSPTYHWTHTAKEIEKWMLEAGLIDIHINEIASSASANKPIAPA